MDDATTAYPDVEESTDVEVSTAERLTARKDVINQIADHLVANMPEGMSNKDKVDELVAAIKASNLKYGVGAAVRKIIELADLRAGVTISKQLAKIANNPNSLKAFCPKCGRHYRYHNRDTGDCPSNPFDAADDDE